MKMSEIEKSKKEYRRAVAIACIGGAGAMIVFTVLAPLWIKVISVCAGALILWNLLR